jgi:hypothetical protein
MRTHNRPRHPRSIPSPRAVDDMSVTDGGVSFMRTLIGEIRAISKAVS